MRTLSIDIETYLPEPLAKCGVYRYCQSPEFQILLFGYSVDGGPVQVVDFTAGEELPPEVYAAMTDPEVIKLAFNAQFTSYEAQVDYYTNYIKSRDDWEFIEMYTDEGITGTNTKHRVGFKRMVADVLNGKIDLIFTKSVSRSARNTVDSLTTVRQLKEKGVEIYFEKENIWTLDSKG